MKNVLRILISCIALLSPASVALAAQRTPYGLREDRTSTQQSSSVQRDTSSSSTESESESSESSDGTAALSSSSSSSFVEELKERPAKEKQAGNVKNVHKKKSKAFNPQPEPPGKAKKVQKGSTVKFNPQPEPPGKNKEKSHSTRKKKKKP